MLTHYNILLNAINYPKQPFGTNGKRAVVFVCPILLAAKGCLCFLERSTTPQTTALGWQTSSDFRHAA